MSFLVSSAESCDVKTLLEMITAFVKLPVNQYGVMKDDFRMSLMAVANVMAYGETLECVMGAADIQADIKHVTADDNRAAAVANFVACQLFQSSLAKARKEVLQAASDIAVKAQLENLLGKKLEAEDDEDHQSMTSLIMSVRSLVTQASTVALVKDQASARLLKNHEEELNEFDERLNAKAATAALKQRILFFEAIQAPLADIGKGMEEGTVAESVEAALNGAELLQCLTAVNDIGFDKVLDEKRLDLHVRFMSVCSRYHQTLTSFAKDAEERAESANSPWAAVVDPDLSITVQVARCFDDFMNFDDDVLELANAHKASGHCTLLMLKNAWTRIVELVEKPEWAWFTNLMTNINKTGLKWPTATAQVSINAFREILDYGATEKDIENLVYIERILDDVHKDEVSRPMLNELEIKIAMM